MYKKIILSLLFLTAVNTSFAKKVKFAVDMATHTISPLGIHVMGDFQTAAGYSLNFDPGSITMNQQGATTIYTVIVNLPAFQKYEFKFVNGDQTYEVEFVPDHARVGYNFNDNRWMYVDSLQNDTSFLGAIKFGANAPAGKTLIRYIVDMQNAGAISPSGVHVGSTFQGNNPATHKLVNLDGTKYEIIAYTTTGVQSFKYYNGNNAGTSETVPANCATTGLRTHNLVSDTILIPVCFSACSACPVGINENKIEYSSLKLFPNPSAEYVRIENPDSNGAENIILVDISGKIADEINVENNKTSSIDLDLKKYSKGVYQVYLKNKNTYRHSKLIIQ